MSNISLHFNHHSDAHPRIPYWNGLRSYYSSVTLRRIDDRFFRPTFVAVFDWEQIAALPSQIVYAQKFDRESEDEDDWFLYEYMLVKKPNEPNRIYVLSNQDNSDQEVNDFIGFEYYPVKIPSERSFEMMTTGSPSSLEEKPNLPSINIQELKEQLLTGSVEMYTLYLNDGVSEPREPLVPHPERKPNTYLRLLSVLY